MIELLTVAVLLLLGWLVGGAQERRHFRTLAVREAATAQIYLHTARTLGDDVALDGPTPRLITAEVVIGSDYLKTFLAQLRLIFGGELKSYRSLLERARREGLVRVREAALRQGFNGLANVHLATSQLNGEAADGDGAKLPCVVILVSATAYRRKATAMGPGATEGAFPTPPTGRF